ncbi:SUKH-3 domain-containing protein [Streptomyces sp. NBC_01795]|nr:MULTISPECIES: SUKH-3 domain-containing protein [unclassified Streptomyces]WSA94260.1 SUKH-3 domain-containing protein [Streptomyces sp. NBC_01795]WSB78677.1 SUKH-3 domain-containing protein [Streptomyces sp. NBC_01775]WSS13118.1 SUKH-3 domain-containing protein [Streptomyces sp. NBC_01186]WSS41902.1 SUKH-3 domain-containing protein [Streptomyces sp. NBC_01187]
MTTRFPVAVDDPLRNAGWEPGRWDIRQAERWADTLRGHTSPGGHRHAVFPAAVEVWAEFGALNIVPTGPGRHLAPAPVLIDPLPGLHAARTLSDLGRALDTQICPLGTEGEGEALLVIDAQRRVYSLDPTGDWYLGPGFDAALSALLMGLVPARLSANTSPHSGTPAQDTEAADGAQADGPAGSAEGTAEITDGYRN